MNTIKNKRLNRQYFGFTLIELLVVISIIGILVAFVSFNFTGTLKATRDTQRKSDLKAYQTAIEGLANKNNGLYYTRITSPDSVSNLCSTLGMGSNCPQDPLYGTSGYQYTYDTDCNTTNSHCASVYTLYTKLEDVDRYWVICSNGRSGNSPSATFSGSTCPF